MAEFKYQFDNPKAAFAEAEKRIQDARNKRAKTLDLRLLGLTELPESVGQLTWLYWRPSRAFRLSERVDFPKETAFKQRNEFKDLVV